MVIIDLGDFFKIHTVKLWNTLDGYQTLGVMIYVDDQLIGSIHDNQ